METLNVPTTFIINERTNSSVGDVLYPDIVKDAVATPAQLTTISNYFSFFYIESIKFFISSSTDMSNLKNLVYSFPKVSIIS